MNLILFEAAEIERPLPIGDPRAAHLLGVLKRGEGGTFDAGVVNGPRGKGTLVAIGSDALRLDFAWGETPPELDPIVLLIGLPRPQTARKILQEAASLGVSALHFVTTEKGERGYAQSTLWSSGEWRRHLRSGAEQAFCTRVPELSYARSLLEVIAGIGGAVDLGCGSGATAGSRIALDNYEATRGLGGVRPAPPVTLAIGPERGWSATERELLRAAGFELAHLGKRVLRAETACVAAVSIIRAGMGLM